MKTHICSRGLWIVIAAFILAVGGLASQAASDSSEPPAAHQVVASFNHLDTEPEVATIKWNAVPAIQMTQTLTHTAYLPAISRGYFDAYTYQENFENWESGWAWGTSPFDYGYKQDGDGSRVYYIAVQDEHELAFVTGPEKHAIARGNFEYEVWMRIGSGDIPKYWYDEYGILISPTPIDPVERSGANVYTFQIKLRIADDQDSLYSVAKWNTLNRSDRSVLVEVAESNYIADALKVWNRFKITRSNRDTLDFYLTCEGRNDWKHVYSITDSTLPDQLYIGFYAKHSKDDFGDYEIEFQFDNLRLSAHL